MNITHTSGKAWLRAELEYIKTAASVEEVIKRGGPLVLAAIGNGELLAVQRAMKKRVGELGMWVAPV
jgi:hypothetical protein